MAGWATAVSASGLVLLLAASAAAAKPATFKVNKTADTAPNGCTRSNCTLREATLAANAHGGTDTIVLAAGKSYVLAIPGLDEDASATGDLDLTGPTTIRATKPGKRASIDADGIDRVLHALAPLTLIDLAVRGGDSSTALTKTGGGVLAEARLDTKRVLFADDKSINGGAVGVASGPGAFMNRTAVEGADGFSTIAELGTGSLKLTDSRIADSPLGGIAVIDYDLGGISLIRSRVLGAAGDGVLEFDPGGVSLAGSRVKGGAGSGVDEVGAGGATVSGSKLSGNAGVGVQASGTGELSVSRSTVSGNGIYGVAEIGGSSASVARTKVNDNAGYGIVEAGEGNLSVSRSSASGNDSYGIVEADGGSLSAARTTASRNGDYGVVETDPGKLALSRVAVTDGDGYGIVETGEGALDASRTSSLRNALYGLFESDDGDVSLSRSRVSANAYGPIETDEGDLAFRRSLASGNDSSGLIDDGPGGLTVLRSTVSGNESSGIYHIGADPGTISKSTVSANQTASSGGGIVNASGVSLNVLNSTVANNRAASDGGGALASGAGSVLNVNNSTIVRNRADSDADGAGEGGGLAVAAGGVELHNSIVALNSNEPDSSSPDCFGTIASGGSNLFSTSLGCTGLVIPPDLVKANPRLGSLKDNGGPTRTIALLKGSPAINASGSGATKTDQRGVKRLAKRDLGAFERR